MYAEILTEDDVETRHIALDVALAEAAEREMVLTSSDIIARIFVSMGGRDPSGARDHLERREPLSPLKSHHTIAAAVIRPSTREQRPLLRPKRAWPRTSKLHVGSRLNQSLLR